MVDDASHVNDRPEPHRTRALDAALELVAAGYHVAPVIIRRDPSTGKKVGDYLRLRWHDAATDDPAVVRDWYVQYGDRVSFLVDTGRSGVFAVDLDVTPEGTGEAVWAEAGMPAGGMVVRTPGGGFHHYFRAPDGDALTVHKRIHGHPIDVRADGGHVYAPGSAVLGPTGEPELRGYELAGPLVPAAALPVLPEVVAGFLKARRSSARKAPEAQGEIRTRTQVMDICRAQLERVQSHPRREGSGFRGVLMGAALALGRGVAAGLWSRRAAEERLVRAVAMVWRRADGDDRRWIRDGLDDGERDPWTVVADDYDTTVPHDLGKSITSMIDSPSAVTQGDTASSEAAPSFNISNGDLEMVDAGTVGGTDGGTAEPDALAELEELDTWAPVGAELVAAILDGQVQAPTPAVGVVRADGVPFLYPGLEHAVIGEMEAGKSWFALACVAAELKAGRRVAYMHFEEADPTSTYLRLHRQFAVERAVLLERFVFVGPERRITATDVDRILAPGAPSLVVLDGVNEAMALHGMAIYDADGASEYRRKLVRPWKRVGASVLSLDHVPKDPEGRGSGYAFGSVAKGNGLDGALMLLENVEPFGDGRRGATNVYVTKDRHGQLRKLGRQSEGRSSAARKFYVGRFVIDAETPGAWRFDFYPPAAPDAAPDPDRDFLGQEREASRHDAEVDADVLEVVRRFNVDQRTEPSGEMVKDTVKRKRDDVRRSLNRMVLDGRLIQSTGSRGGKTYTVK
jgi:hypothetical protein